jgi:hypothetical protein
VHHEIGELLDLLRLDGGVVATQNKRRGQ